MALELHASLILLFIIFVIITTASVKLQWLVNTWSNHTKATSNTVDSDDDDKTVHVTVTKPKPKPSVCIKRITGFDGPQYQEVEKHFREQWTKTTHDYPVPPIPVVIYAIRNDDLTNKYRQYKQKTFSDSSKPNEEWYFHGTSIKCDIITSNKCCDDNTCGVCGITKNGFDLSFIRNGRFQRFGRGIYLAPNSSKSNDYAKSNQYVNYRAQLLCLVACGNKCMLFNDDRSLLAPPTNCHSVYGKASTNGKLNYDELVIYNTDAINPQFIVVYGNRSEANRVQATSTNTSSSNHHYSSHSRSSRIQERADRVPHQPKLSIHKMVDMTKNLVQDLHKEVAKYRPPANDQTAPNITATHEPLAREHNQTSAMRAKFYAFRSAMSNAKRKFSDTLRKRNNAIRTRK